MPADPAILDVYAKTLRLAYDSVAGEFGDVEDELEGSAVLFAKAEQLAEQLERSILDAPWKRAETLKLVDEWISGGGDVLDAGELYGKLTVLYDSPARALLIGRTETANVFNGALAGALKAHGWNFVEWIAASDACEECAALDGEVMSIEEYEANSTLHPNCSCTCKPAPDPDDEDVVDEEEGVDDAVDDAGA